MSPFVIMTCEIREPGLSAIERKVVADVDNGEVWLVVTGPMQDEALDEDVGRWLAALVGPGVGPDVCMAPVSWIEGKLPQDAEPLHFVRDGALDAARKALGQRLH